MLIKYWLKLLDNLAQGLEIIYKPPNIVQNQFINNVEQGVPKLTNTN